MKYGINVSKVALKDKDPSDVGYKNMLNALDCATNVDQYDLILQKLAVSSL
jgi:translation initiation factor IF-3